MSFTNLYARIAWDDGLAYVSTTQYTSTMFLEDIWIIWQDIKAIIDSKRKGDFSWDIWLTDTVSLQDEYTQPNVSSTTVWASYIETLSVTYDNETYTDTGLKKYIPCRNASYAEMSNWNWYLENQPKTDPIYFQKDGSIFIAPDPRSDEVGTNRIQIKGIRSLATGNWTLSTTIEDTKLPLNFEEVLVYWCVWKAMQRVRREPNVIANAKNEYLYERDNAINLLNSHESFINPF